MKKYRLLLILTLGLLALDQLSKLWIVQNLNLGESISVIPGIFEVVHVRNKGAAFGFLNSWDSQWRNLFFYIISGVALVFLLSIYQKSKPSQLGLRISLSLIFGGALGNLWDRIQRGSVVDFLNFHYYNKVAAFSLLGKDFRIPLDWPAFNVADMAISVGALLLAWHLFKSEKTSTTNN